MYRNLDVVVSELVVQYLNSGYEFMLMSTGVKILVLVRNVRKIHWKTTTAPLYQGRHFRILKQKYIKIQNPKKGLYLDSKVGQKEGLAGLFNAK